MYAIRQRQDKVPHIMRDGEGKDAPMRELCWERYTLFKSVPKGINEADPYFEIIPLQTAKQIDDLQRSLEEQLKADVKDGAAYHKRVMAKIERLKKESAANMAPPENKPMVPPRFMREDLESQKKPELEILAASPGLELGEKPKKDEIITAIMTSQVQPDPDPEDGAGDDEGGDEEG